jgi:hypothetical protein
MAKKYITDLSVGTQEVIDSDPDYCITKGRWYFVISLAILASTLLAGGVGVGAVIGAGRKKTLPLVNSSSSPRKPTRDPNDILVGPIFYPWYGCNFHNGDDAFAGPYPRNKCQHLTSATTRNLTRLRST